MKDFYVSYEQAIKFKELELSGEVTGKYVDCPNDPTLFHGMLYQSWNLENDEILAPRLDQAQTWLREEEGFIIVINPAFYQNRKPLMGYYYEIYNKEKGTGFYIKSTIYNSYNEALSESITKCLEILLEI